MNLLYFKQPIKRWTFEMPKVKKWIETNCKGRVLNLFAGKTKLIIPEIRVDISDEYSPDYTCDAYEFVKNTSMVFDTIILDPPYALRKSMEKYNGKIMSNFNAIKNELPRILNNKGRVITFGYHSVSMGKSRGFTQKEILLIGHSGAYHDTIVVIEEQ